MGTTSCPSSTMRQTPATLDFLFCLTICIFTDHLDSSTCTALGNGSLTFENGSYRRHGGGIYIPRFRKRADVHN